MSKRKIEKLSDRNATLRGELQSARHALAQSAVALGEAATAIETKAAPAPAPPPPSAYEQAKGIVDPFARAQALLASQETILKAAFGLTKG